MFRTIALFLVCLMASLGLTAETTTPNGLIFKALADFPATAAGEVAYYRDAARHALAINAAVVTNRGKFAHAQRTFTGAAGRYDVEITTLTEEDGESSYRLLVNGTQVGEFMNPRVDKAKDSQPQKYTWTNINVPASATLAIESNTHSNGLIPEAKGFAWARGRWTQIELKIHSSPVNTQK